VKFANTEAQVALILCSDGADGRPLVSEFSFRYLPEDTRRSAGSSEDGHGFFETTQPHYWCLPDARTKTQYILEPPISTAHEKARHKGQFIAGSRKLPIPAPPQPASWRLAECGG
jgi:hypothetical protein